MHIIVNTVPGSQQDICPVLMANYAQIDAPDLTPCNCMHLPWSGGVFCYLGDDMQMVEIYAQIEWVFGASRLIQPEGLWLLTMF